MSQEESPDGAPVLTVVLVHWNQPERLS